MTRNFKKDITNVSKYIFNREYGSGCSYSDDNYMIERPEWFAERMVKEKKDLDFDYDPSEWQPFVFLTDTGSSYTNGYQPEVRLNIGFKYMLGDAAKDDTKIPDAIKNASDIILYNDHQNILLNKDKYSDGAYSSDVFDVMKVSDFVDNDKVTDYTDEIPNGHSKGETADARRQAHEEGKKAYMDQYAGEMKDLARTDIVMEDATVLNLEKDPSISYSDYNEVHCMQRKFAEDKRYMMYDSKYFEVEAGLIGHAVRMEDAVEIGYCDVIFKGTEEDIDTIKNGRYITDVPYPGHVFNDLSRIYKKARSEYEVSSNTAKSNSYNRLQNIKSKIDASDDNGPENQKQYD